MIAPMNKVLVLGFPLIQTSCFFISYILKFCSFSFLLHSIFFLFRVFDPVFQTGPNCQRIFFGVKCAPEYHLIYQYKLVRFPVVSLKNVLKSRERWFLQQFFSTPRREANKLLDNCIFKLQCTPGLRDCTLIMW